MPDGDLASDSSNRYLMKKFCEEFDKESSRFPYNLNYLHASELLSILGFLKPQKDPHQARGTLSKEVVPNCGKAEERSLVVDMWRQLSGDENSIISKGRVYH